MDHELHPQAKSGFSEEHTEHYNRARPYYPSEAYSYLRRSFETKSSLNIVEIGSGTGIFTRGLLSHPEWSGDSIAEIKAIEPGEGMRRVFSDTVHDTRVSISDGTFDKTGVPDGWADLIAIATAFHWCLDFDAAIREFCRILKPHGIVFLIWNLVAGNRIPWAHELCDIPARYDPLRNHESHRFRGVFNSPLYDPYFEPAEEKEIQHEVPSTPAGVTARVLSWSAIAPLSDSEKEKVKGDVAEILQRGDGLEWIDKEKGLLKFPHDCLAVILQRKRSEWTAQRILT